MLARGDIRGGTEKIKVTLNTSRTRNDFQPAHVELQLPLELLQKVFLLSVESKSYYQGYYARKLPGNYGHLSGPPEWIAITYVCRYWRLAALGLPELWSSINEAYSISWLRVMIERSAPLPMHIDIYISHINPIARLASLAAAELLASSRIRTLSLSGSPIDVLNVLSRLSNPSPIESLSLKVFDDREPVDLPDALFGRDAPHLRHLTFVSSAYIRAPLWLLSRITHFNIGASISRDVLLDMLNAMPQLEVLHASPPLNQTLVTEAPGQLRRSHAVLPRLSFLSIRDSRLYHFVTLSSYINARPTLRTRLHINLDPRWGITSNIFTDLRALFPHDSAPGMDDGGLRVAQVTGRPASGLFEVWSRTISRSGGASAGAFPCEDALFLLRVEWTSPYAPKPNDLGPFFHLTRFCLHLCTAARIEDLIAAPEIPSPGNHNTDVQGPVPVEAQWQALLAAFPAVKTLRLHCGSPACLAVLRTLSASTNFLPLLRRVFVVQSTVRYAATSAEDCDGVGVSGAGAGSAIPSSKFVKVNLGADLVKALRGRSGLEVVLVGCEVDEEGLEALRKWAHVEFGNERVYMQMYM